MFAASAIGLGGAMMTGCSSWQHHDSTASSGSVTHGIEGGEGEYSHDPSRPAGYTEAGATTVGLGLLAPVERLLGRWGSAAVALLALGGVTLAATAFVFLLISEREPLFGFMEPGYDPTAIMASRVAELVTVGLLGSFLVGRFAMKVAVGRW